MKNLFFVSLILFSLTNFIHLQTTGKLTTQKTTQKTTQRTTQRTTQKTTQKTTQGTTAKTSPRTSPRSTSYVPPTIYCYVCSYSTCPRPFDWRGVTKSVSSNGWCAKMSNSEDLNAVATRSVDQGDCFHYGSGCRWATVQGTRTYLCCCKSNLCNNAIQNSKTYFSTFILTFFVILFQNSY